MSFYKLYIIELFLILCIFIIGCGGEKYSSEKKEEEDIKKSLTHASKIFAGDTTLSKYTENFQTSEEVAFWTIHYLRLANYRKVETLKEGILSIRLKSGIKAKCKMLLGLDFEIKKSFDAGKGLKGVEIIPLMPPNMQSSKTTRVIDMVYESEQGYPILLMKPEKRIKDIRFLIIHHSLINFLYWFDRNFQLLPLYNSEVKIANKFMIALNNSDLFQLKESCSQDYWQQLLKNPNSIDQLKSKFCGKYFVLEYGIGSDYKRFDLIHFIDGERKYKGSISFVSNGDKGWLVNGKLK